MATNKTRINGLSPRAQDGLYLHTKGGEFSLNGENYVGEYHRVGDQIQTGPTPSKSAQTLRRLYTHGDHFVYDGLFQFEVRALTFKDPVPYVLVPAEVDYVRGFRQRYFVQKRHTLDAYPIEIDLPQYERLGRQDGIDNGLYAYCSVEWRLVGTRDSIEQFNRLQLLQGSKVVVGLPYAVRSLSEFGRFTDLPNPLLDSGTVKVQLDLPNLEDVRRSIRQHYLRDVG